jgi:Site-specific recombinase XerD
MPMAKLTRRGIAAIQPTDARTFYWDTDLAGFGLRVEPTGRRSWVVEYRPGAGGRNVAKRRLTLGTVQELTPEDARKRAGDILASVRLGGDPAAERKKERAVPSFKEFAATFLKDEADRLKPNTLRNYTSYIGKHLTPAFGTMQIDKITPADVARLHRKVGKTKPTTANRLLETIGSIFRHAALAGHVPKGTNPAAEVGAFREEGRERYLSADELGRLGETLTLAETVGLPYEVDETKPTSKHAPKPENRVTIIDRHACAAIRLLILTGLRMREVLHMRWADIDFERGTVLLPDTKTGRRWTVLNAPTLALLKDLERIGEYVIAGAERDKPRADLNRPWRAVRAHAGLDDVRIHDLRHSFASVAASGGVPLQMIGKLLGHAQAATTQRYAHLADDPLKAASDTIASKIAAAMGGKSAEVIPLPERSRANG